MMMNMLMNFDPYIMNKNSNPMTMTMFYLMLMTSIWKNNKHMKKLMNKNTLNKSNNLILKSMLYIMILMNMINMLPLNNFHTSNMNINLLISMMFWNSTMVMSMMKNKSLIMNLSMTNINKTMFHIIVLIELISKLIQPLTLTIRLTINMMINHIMLSMFNIMPMMMIFPYEIMIIFIQSYVFFMLMSMYFNESY